MSAKLENREVGPCRHRALARGRGIAVSSCSCGHVHLTLGDLTLRVKPAQLEEIAATLGRAVDSLGHEVGAAPPRWLC